MKFFDINQQKTIRQTLMDIVTQDLFRNLYSVYYQEPHSRQLYKITKETEKSSIHAAKNFAIFFDQNEPCFLVGIKNLLPDTEQTTARDNNIIIGNNLINVRKFMQRLRFFVQGESLSSILEKQCPKDFVSGNKTLLTKDEVEKEMVSCGYICTHLRG